MLSIGKVAPRGLAYYTGEAYARGDVDFEAGEHPPVAVADRGSEEYRVGAAEAPGQWWGEGLGLYGLAPGDPVDPGVLAAVLEGRDPRTGERWVGGRVHPVTRDPLPLVSPSPHREQIVTTGGVVLEKRREGVCAYDLTLSADKTISALAAMDPAFRAEIDEALSVATRATVDDWAAQVAVSRRMVAGVSSQIPAEVPAYAVFPHRTSRAGHPQMHHHVLVPNRVLCADGRWRTLDGREIYAAARGYGAVYQARVRAEITQRLGVSWTPVDRTGQAQIAGVPEDLLAHWSRNQIPRGRAHAEIVRINQERAERGIAPMSRSGERAIIAAAISASRTSKRQTREAAHARGLATGMSLEDWWRAEAEALGYTPERIIGGIEQATREARRTVVEATLDPAAIAKEALARASAEHATFARRHVLREVAALMPTDTDPEHVNRLVRECTDLALGLDEAIQVTWRDAGRVPEEHRDVAVVTGRAETEWYTCRTGLETERRIIDRAILAKGAGRGLVTEASMLAALEEVTWETGHPLDESQLRAAVSLAASGDGVEVLEAAAGTGKTSTLTPVARAWAADGYRVVGLAPTAQAASVLERATGIDAATVDRALVEWDGERPVLRGRRSNDDLARWSLDDRTVVVVDEAGMVSRDKVDALTAAADAAGSKIVLIGDSTQLGAVKSASGMFESLGDAVGRSELTTVHRFSSEWERDASLRLREGDASVLSEYEVEGRIRTAETREDVLSEVYDRWDGATEAGKDAIMIAATHDDVDVLNGHARDHGIARHRIRGEAVEIGGRVWQAGDVMLLKSNDARLRVGAPERRKVLGTDARIEIMTTRLEDLRRRTDRAYKVAYRIAPTKGRKVSEKRVAAYRVAAARAQNLQRKTTRTARRLEAARTTATEYRAEWQAAAPVRNGMRVKVERVTAAGEVTAREIGSDGQPGGQVVLPRAYVAEHARYGWADTVHSRQGATAQVCEVVADERMTREQLYVAMTRGSESNTVTVARPEPLVRADGTVVARTAADVLEGIMRRDGRDRSASARMREVAAREERLDSLAVRRERYEAVIRDRAPQADLGALTTARRERDRLRGEIDLLAGTGRDTTYERQRHQEAAEKVARLEQAAATRGDWEARNPALAGAVGRLRERQEARRGLLADRAVRQPSPSLTASLGPVPTEEVRQEGWRRAAGVVAAYEERWHSTGGGAVSAAQQAERRAVEAARATWVTARDGISRGVTAIRDGIGR